MMVESPFPGGDQPGLPDPAPREPGIGLPTDAPVYIPTDVPLDAPGDGDDLPLDDPPATPS
jgi:hypothetical protein